MVEITHDLTNYEGHARYRLKVKGHAGYAPKGEDIVCAAVSTLTLTFANFIANRSVEVLEEKVEEGDFLLDFYTDNSMIIPAYHMVIEGLQAIEEQYPEFVKIFSKWG